MPQAEVKFFNALKCVLGEAHVIHKPGLPIYTKYERTHYKDSVNELAESVLKNFNSTYDFSNMTTPVDGIIVDHTQFGTRVVEFDEYQHFTPMRAKIIELSKSTLPLDFQNHYLMLIETKEVKDKMQVVTRRVGFRKPVAGFQFVNGRMFQRAYFDFLKDYAHLSKECIGFSPIIRFAMLDFEAISGNKFSRIPDNELQEMIDQQLKGQFNL